MQILLMDDDEVLRDVITAALESAGHGVLPAADGLEGMRLLESHVVDCVLCDIFMPEKEGIETIGEIRKSHPDLPILAMTGRVFTAEFSPLHIALKLGATTTLQKPFQLHQLIAAVETLCVRPRSEVQPA